MRVLLLSPTLGLGGAERLAVLYAEGLKQRGHEVLMAFGRRSRWDAHAFSPTVETRLLTEVQLTPKTMLPWVRALRLLIQDFKPDVLFTQSITVAAVAGIAAPRIPHVVMLHGIPDDQERLAAFVLRSSRAHAVAVSDQTANGITRHRGAPPVETLRSGIDIAALERNAEVPIDPPLPEGSPRFIYIGRFVHQKATEILIAAFAQVVAQHPGAQLVCAGIGPELDERKQQAADLGHRRAHRLPRRRGQRRAVHPGQRRVRALLALGGAAGRAAGDARARHAGDRDGRRRLAAGGARRGHGLARAARGRRRVRRPHAGGRRRPGRSASAAARTAGR